MSVSLTLLDPIHEKKNMMEIISAAVFSKIILPSQKSIKDYYPVKDLSKIRQRPVKGPSKTRQRLYNPMNLSLFKTETL